jgi:hypothetical protein
MSNKTKKEIKNNKDFKTQDILTAVLIMLIFTAIISAIFIKLADIVFEIEETTRKNSYNRTKKI